MNASDSGASRTIDTTRAMRRLKPDPVPDALVRKTRGRRGAPNGGNTQRWRFMVVKDRRIKQAVQAFYKRAFDEVVGPRYLKSTPPPASPARPTTGSTGRWCTSPITSTRRRCGSWRAWRRGRWRPPAGRARPSIRPSRTCCWPLARSASGPR